MILKGVNYNVVVTLFFKYSTIKFQNVSTCGMWNIFSISFLHLIHVVCSLRFIFNNLTWFTVFCIEFLIGTIYMCCLY